LIYAAGFAIQLPQSLRYQREVSRSTMEKFDLPEEDIQEALGRIPKWDDLTAAGFAQQIALPVAFLIPTFFLGAVLFHLLAKAFGVEPRFILSLGIFALAQLASALGALLKGVLARASDSVEVSLSPAALVPGAGFESALGIFLDLFDVFSLLNGVLLGIGARVGYGVTPSTGWGIAAVYWIVKSLVVFLLRVMQSWFSGTL
jgi:hypothetical protein